MCEAEGGELVEGGVGRVQVEVEVEGRWSRRGRAKKLKAGSLLLSLELLTSSGLDNFHLFFLAPSPALVTRTPETGQPRSAHHSAVIEQSPFHS